MRGHDKAARWPDLERLQADGKKSRFRVESGQSGNRFLGRGRLGRREQPVYESFISRATLVEMLLTGLSIHRGERSGAQAGRSSGSALPWKIRATSSGLTVENR